MSENEEIPNIKIEGGVHTYGGNVVIGRQIINGGFTIGNVPNTSDATNKETLDEILKSLQKELQSVPPENAKQAESIAKLAQETVNEATVEDADEGMVKIRGEGLLKAAENLAKVAPTVGIIAGKLLRHLLIGFTTG